MRLNRSFVIGIVAFLVLVFITQVRMSPRFVWNPTFMHDDKQPLGCCVMDSLLTASLPNGYTVTDKTLYQLLQEKHSAPRTFMLISPEYEPKKQEVNDMMSLLRRGDNVVLVTKRMYSHYSDSILGFCVPTFYYSRPDFKQEFSRRKKYTLRWSGDRQHYHKRDFILDSPMAGGGIEVMSRSLKADTLAASIYDKEDVATNDEVEADTVIYPCVVAINYGKGKLICCTNPLIFTNYGILDSQCRDIIFRVLSQAGNRPIVRTEASSVSPTAGITQTSPLTFFLSHPPLRWAIYAAIIGVLLYFVFTARRRQRVIPVVTPPENRSLEFVHLIGSLYHQRHDNTGLVRKKFLYFSETLRREIMADIGNKEDDEYNAAMISAHTGIGAKTVRDNLHELRDVIEFDGNIPDAQMRHYIDLMNNIISKL